jgi:hypothetical protein
MNQSNYLFKVANNQSELQEIYKLQYKVFVQDKELLDESNSRLLVDEWDSHSYHAFCKFGDRIIADGRLIRNSEFGFRVSSSINLNDYFVNLDRLFEISGLAVANGYRQLGFKVVINHFHYEQYKSLKPSVFLSFDLSEESAFGKLKDYISDKVKPAMIDYIDNYIERLEND